MPFLASSVQGLPAHTDLPRQRQDDGARPRTAAVCRHLLGDVFAVPVDGLAALRRSVVSRTTTS